jgi:carbon starvation protein
MLLCPRDYLSSYLKIGTIAFLIIGVILVHPNLNMPAFTPFTAGGGPVIPGKLYPFVFITIACGAISGFHALISSGTTPKMIAKETDTRMIGYGSMLMEGVVGVVALIAATSLFPGDYFAINTRRRLTRKRLPTCAWSMSTHAQGFNLQPQEIDRLEQESGEKNLRGRTGGAVTLALGIAKIFDGIPGLRGLMKYWYHFAIMFEALFILTTIDTGTRVARFLSANLAGVFIANSKSQTGCRVRLSPVALVVTAWAAFIWSGSISTIWPMFGIANQLLAAVALCVATTIIINSGKAKYAWVTILPLALSARRRSSPVGNQSPTFSGRWRKSRRLRFRATSIPAHRDHHVCRGVIMIDSIRRLGWQRPEPSEMLADSTKSESTGHPPRGSADSRASL